MPWSTYTSKFQESVLHINIRSAPLWIESITNTSALLVHFTVFDIVTAACFDFLFMNSLRILSPFHSFFKVTVEWNSGGVEIEVNKRFSKGEIEVKWRSDWAGRDNRRFLYALFQDSFLKIFEIDIPNFLGELISFVFEFGLKYMLRLRKIKW